jgi:predicted DNA-binding protein (MmcQ/YjbR family)
MTAAKITLKNSDAKALRKAAMAYPETVEAFPWDHHAYKAGGKKVFLYLTENQGGFNCTMKLPYRQTDALKMKGAELTGYGMGAKGWVTFEYSAKAKPPMTKLLDFLDESWRANAAPKLAASHVPNATKRRKTAAS